MLVNELLFQKLERFAFAFIEIFLFDATENRNERRFVISVLPDTRLTT